MKHISNNSDNSVSFVHESSDFSHGVTIRFNQIGAHESKDVTIDRIISDCFVTTFEFRLEDFTPNGLYTISVYDFHGDMLISDSAVVDGMLEDNKRAYIIEDIVTVVEETNKLTMKLTGKL